MERNAYWKKVVYLIPSRYRFLLKIDQSVLREGREGVKWELGNGILCTGTGIHEKKTIEKWEWDFNLSNTCWDCGILAGI